MYNEFSELDTFRENAFISNICSHAYISHCGGRVVRIKGLLCSWKNGTDCASVSENVASITKAFLYVPIT